MTRNFDQDYQKLLEAAAFAARAHRGHTRKDKETPYISHPFRVCLIVRDLFGFEDLRMLQAALLHDVIEDTTTDFDDVAEVFGPEVAQWAATLSKDKRLPDEQREEAYLDALRQAPWQVKACKLADVFDNLHDSAKLSSGRAHFLDRAEQYYNGLRDDKTPELRRPLELVAQSLAAARAQ
jgi:guanosine-3',5'-bis(diphosphate) 3'-pyrophosphohydrolase